MQSYIEKQNQTILTYKYFVLNSNTGTIPYLLINKWIINKSTLNMVC